MNHLTVKELPDSERPYEKVLQYGTTVLSDAELLAVIFRSGTKGVKSIELAQAVLNLQNQGILNLYYLDLEEMMSISGIGKVKAVQMKCVAELSKRLARKDRRDGIELDKAKSVAAYYMESMRHDCKEKLVLSMFDAKCHLIGDSVVSVGTVNASLVSPREIFVDALRNHAVYIILLHNHPSGNPTPSREDFMVTKRVAECGKLLEIQLSDHIIIGDNKYFSFREKGLL